MIRQQTHRTGRLPDPTISSVIFAPRPRNYTLLSVSTEERISDAIALECLVHPDDFPRYEILEKMRRAILRDPGLISEYLRGYLATSYTTATVTLPTELATPEIDRVPTRAFPFASHLDLLASPEEGLFFDPDEFIER